MVRPSMLLPLLPLGDSANEGAIYYLGDVACVVLEDNKHHDMPNTRGISIVEQNLIGIFYHDPDISIQVETKTTVHEIGHLFGALDHCGLTYPSTEEFNKKFDTNPFSKFCIYGEKKDDSQVLNNLLICDGCKAVINGTLELPSSTP